MTDKIISLKSDKEEIVLKLNDINLTQTDIFMIEQYLDRKMNEDTYEKECKIALAKAWDNYSILSHSQVGRLERFMDFVRKEVNNYLTLLQQKDSANFELRNYKNDKISDNIL